MLRIISKTTNEFLRDDFNFDEETEHALDVAPASGLYKPVWNGDEWVEGLPEAELNALKEESIALYREEMKKKAKEEAVISLAKIQAESTDLTPEQADSVKALFDEFEPDIDVQAGKMLTFNDVLYKVVQPHKTQADWTPDISPSLFAKVLTSPSGEILPWVQPDSTNPYMKGDKVSYEGKNYESLIDNNTWSPVDYPAGWKEI